MSSTLNINNITLQHFRVSSLYFTYLFIYFRVWGFDLFFAWRWHTGLAVRINRQGINLETFHTKHTHVTNSAQTDSSVVVQYVDTPVHCMVDGVYFSHAMQSRFVDVLKRLFFRVTRAFNPLLASCINICSFYNWLPLSERCQFYFSSFILWSCYINITLMCSNDKSMVAHIYDNCVEYHEH